MTCGGAQDPLTHGERGGVLVAGPGHVPRLPGPVGEVAAGGQGVGVFGVQDPLADGEQGGVLAAGSGWVPGLPGPPGQASSSGPLAAINTRETRSLTVTRGRGTPLFKAHYSNRFGRFPSWRFACSTGQLASVSMDLAFPVQ
jgi:hypothetical protein